MSFKESVISKERRKKIEVLCLEQVLQMTRESLSPEVHKGFLKAYNELIKNRHLNLKLIAEN